MEPRSTSKSSLAPNAMAERLRSVLSPLSKDLKLGSSSKLWKLTLQALGNNYNDASEMASMIEELDPGFGVEGHGKMSPDARVRPGSRSHTPSRLRKNSIKDRIRNAVPLSIDEHGIDWSRLLTVVSTEMLSAADDSNTPQQKVMQVDLNSGGSVFFCLFAPSGRTRGQEGLAVVKFGASRLLMQAEQFANELTRHLEICAPDCRIVRQTGPTSHESERIRRAVSKLGEDAADMIHELSNMPCLLLMEFVQGRPLLDCEEAFQDANLIFVMEDLGRLFLLDMMLGNADRLPCVDLRWRGNPNNILFGWKGAKHADRAVAIDSCVQRRPPAAILSHEDEAVDRLAQLALTDDAFALTLLKGSLVAGSRPAVAGLVGNPSECVKAFRRGLRSCLTKVLAIKGLLEMTHEKMVEWVMEFINDIQSSNPELHLPNVTAPQGTPVSPLMGLRPPTPSRTRLRPARSRMSWSGGDSAHTKSRPVPPSFHSPINEDDDDYGAASAASSSSSSAPKPSRIAPQPAHHLDGHSKVRSSPALPALDMRFSSPCCLTSDIIHYHMLRASAPATPTTDATSPNARAGSRTIPPRSPVSAQSPGSAVTSADICTTPLTLDPGPSMWIPSHSMSLRRHSTGNSLKDINASGTSHSKPLLSRRVSMPPNHGAAQAIRSPYLPAVKQASRADSTHTTSQGGIPKSSGLSGHRSTGGTSWYSGADNSPPSTKRTPSNHHHSHSIERMPHSSTASSQSTSKTSGSSGRGPRSTVSRRVSGARAIIMDPASPPPRANLTPPIAQEALGFYQAQHQDNLHLTLAIKAVNSEARNNDDLSMRLQEWKTIFRERGQELQAAVNEWQVKHQVEKVLTTGFLDGTNPIVDVYELKVRLDHMLRRLRVLEEAATACAPNLVLEGLYVGNAVAADTHHVLRHLGITHIVNATQEVLPPPDTAGFTVLMAPLRDVDDEDISSYFSRVVAFIDEARDHTPEGGDDRGSADSSTTDAATLVDSAAIDGARTIIPAANATSSLLSMKTSNVQTQPAVRGSPLSSKQAAMKAGGVLVHCSEGKSRSVTLVLAYLMMSMRWNLKRSLEHVKACRKEAAPNAGFMHKLLELDVQVFGAPSFTRQERARLTVKKGKPEPIRCPECGAAVGVSTASLAVHMKFKHPDVVFVRTPQNSTSSSGGSGGKVV